VVLEAMAAGLPVVSTALAGTRMQVGEAGREFLHAPGDAAGLAGMLAKLCRDGALRAAVGNRMRERARRHFALGPVKERYLAAYRLILAGNRDMIGTVADFPPN
jgi:glycosyltransferase involved in cell wall biosynthesis